MNKKTEGRAQTASSPALTVAIKRLLRPVVGLLLDNGLTYTWLTKILKRIFVDVAESEFKLEGKGQTDSRISLVTGVHRRDVNKLRNEDSDTYEPPKSLFLGPKLIAIWISNKRFLDKNGKPINLPRARSKVIKNGGASFEELVEMVRTDVRPRAVLDEIQRLGVVSINEKDKVCLEIDSFVPSKGAEEKMYFLGRNVHDHIAATRFNVKSKAPPFLERSVYYDALSEKSVAALASLSRKKSSEILQELNKEALKLQKKDAKSNSGKYRMNFGFYFYSDED